VRENGEVDSATGDVSLRVVVIQEGEWLSAQCLEHDFAVQATNLDDLFYQLQRILVGHISTRLKLGVEPFKDVPPAPQKYWDLFEHSRIPLQKPPAMFDPPAPGVKVPPLELRAAPLAA